MDLLRWQSRRLPVCLNPDSHATRPDTTRRKSAAISTGSWQNESYAPLIFLRIGEEVFAPVFFRAETPYAVEKEADYEFSASSAV